MARIRSIHPGFFTDDAVMEASLAARWLLIGIWSECDDQGAFQWKPATLKARIMPNDNVDIPALLDELVALKFLTSYEHEGAKFGLVRNFCKFQRPKKPNTVHVVPNQFRTFVGLTPASSEPAPPSTRQSSEPEPVKPAQVPNQFPTSSPPVPNRYGKDSAEVGGRMEDGGGSSSGTGGGTTKPPKPKESQKTDLERLASILKLDHKAFHRHPKFARFPAFMAEWVEAGADPELDVWPTIIKLAKRSGNITSPAFFDSAIREAIALRQATQPIVTPERWRQRLTHYVRRGVWDVAEWGPKPNEPGCKAPAELVAEIVNGAQKQEATV